MSHCPVLIRCIATLALALCALDPRRVVADATETPLVEYKLFAFGLGYEGGFEVTNVARINEAYLRYDGNFELRFGRWLYRDDRDWPGDRQLSLGLGSRGELELGLDYWANAGLTLGRADGRRLRGFGFDVGGTYRLGDHPWGPRVTLGYAWGSGDRNPGSGTDRTYRQTGLQSNESCLGGLAKFKYCGEALDPDLSDIAIATAGFGITPGERLSLDLIYHHYRQVAPAAGASGRIGRGVDLVVGYRRARNIEVEAAIGWFFPGSSSAPQGGAVARLEIESSF